MVLAIGGLAAATVAQADGGGVRRIRGRVVDHQHEPAVAAEVLAFASPLAAEPIARTWTDGDGRFVIGFAWQPNTSLCIRRPGFADLRIGPLWSARGSAELSVVLSRARDVRVRVHTREGAPIAGARVFEVARSGGSCAARTDERGQASLVALPCDTSLFVHADGFLPARLAVDSCVAGVLDCVLERGATGTIRIRVPAAHLAEVNAALAREHAGTIARLEPAGPVALGPDGVAVLEGLVPGRYVAAADGLREAFVSPMRGDLAPGATLELAFERLAPDRRVVRGRVVDRAGRAVGGLALLLRELRSERRIDVADDGTFRFESRVPANLPIAAWLDSERWAVDSAQGGLDGPFTIEAGVCEPTIVVRRIAVVRGVVVDSRGCPLASRHVFVGQALAATDLDGRFVLRVSDQPTTGEAIARGSAGETIGASGYTLGPDGDDVTIRCASPARVSVRVVDRAGRPLEGLALAIVRVVPNGTHGVANARSDATGAIAVPPLWSGDYEVREVQTPGLAGLAAAPALATFTIDDGVRALAVEAIRGAR